MVAVRLDDVEFHLSVLFTLTFTTFVVAQVPPQTVGSAHFTEIPTADPLSQMILFDFGMVNERFVGLFGGILQILNEALSERVFLPWAPTATTYHDNKPVFAIFDFGTVADFAVIFVFENKTVFPSLM